MDFLKWAYARECRVGREGTGSVIRTLRDPEYRIRVTGTCDWPAHAAMPRHSVAH